MDYPMKKQKLQTLYPGRYLSYDTHYTGDNISPEDPEGLDKSRSRSAAMERAARMETEALSRHLGGKDKFIRGPAIDPDAKVEDPAKRFYPVSDEKKRESQYLKDPPKLDPFFKKDQYKLPKYTKSVEKFSLDGVEQKLGNLEKYAESNRTISIIFVVSFAIFIMLLLILFL